MERREVNWDCLKKSLMDSSVPVCQSKHILLETSGFFFCLSACHACKDLQIFSFQQIVKIQAYSRTGAIWVSCISCWAMYVCVLLKSSVTVKLSELSCSVLGQFKNQSARRPRQTENDNPKQPKQPNSMRRKLHPSHLLERSCSHCSRKWMLLFFFSKKGSLWNEGGPKTPGKWGYDVIDCRQARKYTDR